MNRIIFCSLLLLISCYSYSQTQLEINNAEQQKFLTADKELNRIYKQILSDYKDDTAFVRNIKASQRLWVQFRDAEMNMMYPQREPGYYGSIHPTCWAVYKTELTNERTKKLRKWLTGQEEGDSCSPSIKLRTNAEK